MMAAGPVSLSPGSPLLPHLCGMWVAATEENRATWDHRDTQRPQPWFPNLLLTWLCRPEVGTPVPASPLQEFPKDKQFWADQGVLHCSLVLPLWSFRYLHCEKTDS